MVLIGCLLSFLEGIIKMPSDLSRSPVIENPLGRVRVFVTGATALVVVEPSADRLELLFQADGTVFLLPGPVDVTVTTGIPVLAGSSLEIRGNLSQHRWTVISAATPILGVVEYFPGEEEPLVPAIPTGTY